MNALGTALALLALTALAACIADLIAARALAREVLRWLETPWGLR